MRAATQGDGFKALVRLFALATALTLPAGGALAHDPGASHSKHEAKRLRRAHREDMAQHPKIPELREEAVEMLVAHRCIRVGYTIWPTD